MIDKLPYTCRLCRDTFETIDAAQAHYKKAHPRPPFQPGAIPKWIVMGREPEFATCRRCGRAEPKPEMPMLLDAFVAYLKFVGVKHAHCEQT